MKLDPSLQLRLLELVDAQRTADTPSEEQRELDRLNAGLAQARSLRASSALNVTAAEADLQRIEADIAKLKKREKADREGLGAATDQEIRRDLEHDLAVSIRRSDDLRGELKEIHDELHALRRVVDTHDAAVSTLEQRISSITLPAPATGRVEELRALFDAPTLQAFDTQAAEGVGAAPFSGRSCGGCFVVLPAQALSTIRSAAANEVPRCPECGTYLVRG